MMWQTWCLCPLRFVISQAPQLNTKFSTCTVILVFSMYAMLYAMRCCYEHYYNHRYPAPSLYVTFSLAHVAAELFALGSTHNLSALFCLSQVILEGIYTAKMSSSQGAVHNLNLNY
jgi:hypothetical protein